MDMQTTKMQEDQKLVSIIVSAAIDRRAPRRTQKELAREMGFPKPGMLSMIKTGAARIPFTKLPSVAAALGIDPALLVRTYLCETWPEFEDVVHEVFGGVLTEAEREWIEFFGGMGMLAPPVDSEMREKLQRILLAHEGRGGRSMKALSIWRPWASLIMSGHKKIETQSRAGQYLGQRS